MKKGCLFILLFTHITFAMEEGSNYLGIDEPIKAFCCLREKRASFYVGLAPILSEATSPPFVGCFNDEVTRSLKSLRGEESRPNELLFRINAFNDLSGNFADNGIKDKELSKSLPTGIFPSLLPYKVIKDWKEGKETELNVHVSDDTFTFLITLYQTENHQITFEKALKEKLKLAHANPNYVTDDKEYLIKMGVLAYKKLEVVHGKNGFDFTSALKRLESDTSKE